MFDFDVQEDCGAEADLVERSKAKWDEAHMYNRIIVSGLMPDGTPASKAAIGKAKRRRKECRDESERLAAEAKKEARRQKEQQFKQSIRGDVVVDKNGNVVRPYTFIERVLDNKVLIWSLLIGFMLLMLVIVFVQSVTIRGGLFG
jgi:Fe2+ transport system protein B